MRLYLVFIVILCSVIWSCSEKIEKKQLQEKEIALAQPRISATSKIIDSSVVITADLQLDGVEIFYTNDGSDPTTQSIKYKQPFESSEEGVYTFKAFHTSWKPSEKAELKLYKKGFVPNEVKWHTNPNRQYEGMGWSTLINQEKAVLNFRDQQWVGFDSIAMAEVYFEKKRHIETINIGYLVDVASWIFPPTSIKISSSDMDPIVVEIPKLNQSVPRALKDRQIKIGKELSSVRIEILNLQEIPDWHDGKGSKAWLFMDEWIFK